MEQQLRGAYMIEAAAVVLTMIADGFIAALSSKITEETAARLRGEPAKQALRLALGDAIRKYATTGTRLDLAAPLLHQDGVLTQPAVAEQLALVVRFDQEPNYQLIADRWRAALERPPAWRNFNDEARLLLSYLTAELRRTDVFRPVFDSRSLDSIADTARVSVDHLAALEAQLVNLKSLIDTRFGELIQIFDTADPGIRDQIRDFSSYIENKTRSFVGRQFVFDAVAAFMQQQSSGYFIVRGDPGIGKTALSAQLVKMAGHFYHFNIRAEGISRAEMFLRSICAQLIARYNLGYEQVPPEAVQDAGFLGKLLDAVSERLGTDNKAVLVVDALDEVDNLGMPAGANTLFLPVTLPQGVYIIATTRKVPLSLRIDSPHQTLDIEQDSAGNIADVRLYVEQALTRPGVRAYAVAQGIDDTRFVDLLLTKSQGNFMYLHYVLPELERGAYRDTELKDLPNGLRNYYDDHWRRMRGQDETSWFTYKLPIVMALTVVKEPVSINLLADFSGVDDRRRIRSVLQDWQAFLHEEAADDGSLEKRYRVYHASFHDFIADKEEIVDERVSRKEANQRIADRLWADLYGDASQP